MTCFSDHWLMEEVAFFYLFLHPLQSMCVCVYVCVFTHVDLESVSSMKCKRCIFTRPETQVYCQTDNPFAALLIVITSVNVKNSVYFLFLSFFSFFVFLFFVFVFFFFHELMEHRDRCVVSTMDKLPHSRE